MKISVNTNLLKNNYTKYLYFVALLFIVNNASSQLAIDFENNQLTEFTQYPENRWATTDETPLSGEYSLRHFYDNTESSRDRIAYPFRKNLTNHRITWRFLIKYEYNPSGSNNWGIFLMSDKNAEEMHPSGSANGYLIGVNYSGSDDMIKLWKVSSGSGYQIINTEYNWENNIDPGTIIGIEVIRDEYGEWIINIAENGDFNNLTQIGTGENNEYNLSEYIGVYYEYTSTADSKLWLDDIMIETELIDTIAPKLTDKNVSTASNVKLEFSEPMDSLSISEKSNYLLNDTVTPQEISIIKDDNSLIALSFQNSFQDSVENILNIKNITDRNGNPIQDTCIQFMYKKMRVTDFSILTDSSAKIKFSRQPDSLSAINPINYLINDNYGHPEAVIYKASEPERVTLQFEPPLQANQQYTLTVQDIHDIHGDPMQEFSQDFIFQKPQKNDIVINEVMADPIPSAGLPEYEYIELYNPNNYPLNLNGWELQINSRTKSFESYTVNANEYLILCDDEVEDEFSEYGNTYSFSGFPALNNSGAGITLKDSSQKTINSVFYSDEWYQDEEKENGGFSLEKIDPLNNCSGKLNWTATKDDKGGTPGTLNSVDAPNIDSSAPHPKHFSCLTSNQLKISFNEALAPEVYESPENFYIPGKGHPFSILKPSEEANSIELLFNIAFEQDSTYKLQIQNLKDLCDNDTSLTLNFTYHKVRPYDIVISEAMAKPDPSKGLPEEEYIELYNRSEFDISIEGWKLTTGNRTKTLSQYTIPAKAYLILCDTEHETEFQEYGKTMGIESFPAINNTEAQIYLETEDNTIVDFVPLRVSWHENEHKREGGWSLEMIDPGNPCGEKENWNSSVDYEGGTPGETNSIIGENPDNQPISIRTISVVDHYTIKVHFSEVYDRETATDKSKYTVKNISEPIFAEPVPPEYKSIVLTFQEPFKKQVRYTLEIDRTVKDCAGNNNTEKISADFEIPERPENKDIVINEVLFNPWPEGNEFIELYNRSDKTVEISDLCIANEEDNTGCLHDHSFQLFPGSYIILTQKTESIKKDYYTPHSNNFIETEEMPRLNNREGSVYIYDKGLNVIDHFEYNDEMHFPLLIETQGVSLERIHFDRNTNNKENWHSAASSAGYATPGYINSQFTEKQAEDSRFTIAPEVFSPDNDGRDDVLSIKYKLSKPGNVVTIRIFDNKGRVVRNLVNNKTLATTGEFTWNGLNDNNQKARMGIYLIYIELFDLEGNTEVIKKHCVLGGQY